MAKSGFPEFPDAMAIADDNKDFALENMDSERTGSRVAKTWESRNPTY
jgi:hypothetical protein